MNKHINVIDHTSTVVKKKSIILPLLGIGIFGGILTWMMLNVPFPA